MSARWSRRFLAFLIALAIAVVWGAVWQTQSNLDELQALGATIPASLRARTTGQDLLGFGPLYAAVVAVAFALAFPIAARLARRGARGVWFTLAGWCALLVAIRLIDAATPPPVLIAATRSTFGWLGMTAGGALGGLTYAWLMRVRVGGRSV